MPSTDEWRKHRAPTEIIHAQGQRSLRIHYERGLGQRQILPLLPDLAEHRPRLLEAGRNAESAMARDIEDAGIERVGHVGVVDVRRSVVGHDDRVGQIRTRDVARRA